MLPLLLPITLHAQVAQQPPVVIWPHGVSPLGPKHKDAFGNHTLSVSIHDDHSVAEVHEAGATLMIVQTGEADLVYGGEVVNPQRLSPTEVRGTSIRNGTTIHVAPGDVIHFAPGVPHQWIVAPGHTITFLVVHITDPSTH
jgi:hypothetical protein